MANVSRTVIAAARAAYADVVVVLITAPAEVLAGRIAARARDSDGSIDSGMVSATRSYDRLIASIVAAGGPRYAVAQIDPVDGADGGAPGGNIRVAFLYDPQRVGFVPRPGGGAEDVVGQRELPSKVTESYEIAWVAGS